MTAFGVYAPEYKACLEHIGERFSRDVQTAAMSQDNAPPKFGLKKLPYKDGLGMGSLEQMSIYVNAELGPLRN